MFQCVRRKGKKGAIQSSEFFSSGDLWRCCDDSPGLPSMKVCCPPAEQGQLRILSIHILASNFHFTQHSPLEPTSHDWVMWIKANRSIKELVALAQLQTTLPCHFGSRAPGGELTPRHSWYWFFLSLFLSCFLLLPFLQTLVPKLLPKCLSHPSDDFQENPTSNLIQIPFSEFPHSLSRIISLTVIC